MTERFLTEGAAPEVSRRRILAGSASMAAGLAMAGQVAAQTAEASSDAAPIVARPALPASGNTILVTGGGSGIGLGLAAHFHAAGNTVIIASRRTRLLEDVASGFPDMHAMTVDIRDPYSVRRFAAEVTEAFPALNVLVNNAGIMRREDMFDAVDFLADSQDQVETNLNGMIRVTSALLPHLGAQPRARVINISSGLAFVPRAAFATYSATKAATHAFSLSLRHQLRDTPIDVVEIAPPPVRTEILPGQSQVEALLTVEDFVGQAMALYAQSPVPPEIIVPRAAVPRNAEAEGRFWRSFAAINQLDG